MGELMLMYGVSDIAFVGGSLVKHGGHNPLEPLAFKMPVITGKHTFNFLRYLECWWKCKVCWKLIQPQMP